LKQKNYEFSIQRKTEEGAYADNKKVVFNLKGETFDMTLEELALQGKHNIYNSMAAGVAAKLVGIRKETIKQCLSDFQNVEHRLESVANIHGIEFINDSKATNINSVWYALESLNNKVIWIAGGIDKGNDYTKLFELVKQKVKAIVCLGIDNEKLIDAFKDKVEFITETSSAEEAVSVAYYLARKGDTVLLSPACASFDLFENYEERGRKFKEAVKAL
jgi:UDP-N-acetylmuramoylalanine--D-glutamate ligase